MTTKSEASDTLRPLLESAWSAKACDICGEASELVRLGERSHDIAMRNHRFAMRLRDVLCSRCGFVFEGEIPSQDFLSAYYAEAFDRQSAYQTIEPDYDADARLEPIRRYLRPGSSIYEVGASDGAFCRSLTELGFVASGVDPVADRHDSDVVPAFVTKSDDRASHATYDAVVSYYVLEHVVCAKSWLSASAANLRPGGLLVLEVPDYSTHASISLSQEHMLHFTPHHLTALVSQCGFEPLSAPGWRPSRDFGFVLVARLSDPEKLAKPSPYRPDGNETRRVDDARAHYDAAIEVFRREDARTATLAGAIADEASRHEDAVVCFWPANVIASRISAALAELSSVERRVIDNAKSKIGLHHEAFDHAIQAPDFDLADQRKHLFVLCSPSWNAQIEKQVRDIGLKAFSIHDGSLYTFG